MLGCSTTKSKLVLPKDPRVEWKGCNSNEMTLGLGDEDFMHLQVYIKQLEHLLRESYYAENTK